MKPSEALAILAAIQAFRPYPALPPATQDAWVQVLVTYEAVDALEAVPVVGRMGGFLELAQIEAAIREARGRRLATQHRRELPKGPEGISFHTYLEQYATDDEREAVGRMSPGLRRELAQMTKGASDVPTHSASG